MAVASRTAGIDQTGVEQEPPDSMAPHVAALRCDPAAANLLDTGWRVAVVDLTRIFAAQPLIYADHAEERVATADPLDIMTLATISLPITTPSELPAQFDIGQKAWVFSSANPNLRITGVGSALVNGTSVFGFTLALLPSFVRVARYQSRYLLVDGYHRAYGFLRKGITNVPALVSDVASFEALGLPQVGMLPHDAYLGERPPTLADYLNNEVSAKVNVPATQKTILIVGLEVQAAG